MLRKFFNKRGQATFGEYALLFLIIIGMITAMGIYFRRAIQGRMRDARMTMFRTVEQRTGGNYVGNLWIEYEPYYYNTESYVSRIANANASLYQGNTSGLFRQSFQETTTVQTRSITAPPANAL